VTDAMSATKPYKAPWWKPWKWCAMPKSTPTNVLIPKAPSQQYHLNNCSCSDLFTMSCTTQAEFEAELLAYESVPNSDLIPWNAISEAVHTEHSSDFPNCPHPSNQTRCFTCSPTSFVPGIHTSSCHCPAKANTSCRNFTDLLEDLLLKVYQAGSIGANLPISFFRRLSPTTCLTQSAFGRLFQQSSTLSGDNSI